VRIAEDFAPHIHGLSISNRILEHRKAVQLPGHKPWTDDRTIAWLDARVESVRRYDKAEKIKAEAKTKADLAKKANTASSNEPALNVYLRTRRARLTQPIDFWCEVRLRTLARMGRGEEEFARLAMEVRKNPDIAKLMRRYVLASPMVRGINGKKLITEDVKWLADVARLDYATDLRYIGEALMRIEQPASAESFFRLAIDKGITDAEVRGLAKRCPVYVPEKTLRLHFEVDLLEGLSKSLVAQNKNDEAQKMMVKAADVREKNNLGMNPILAGQVQRVSFARVIEGRILEKEKKKENRNDPQYWRDRAKYYRGRKEPVKQEQALRTGLALSKPEPRVRDKGSNTKRPMLLKSLLYFLKEQKLPLIQKALKDIHFPQSIKNSELAKKRFAFEKMLLIQIRVLIAKEKWEDDGLKEVEVERITTH
jgi:tetratricopeptide (TPR) repeat protein